MHALEPFAGNNAPNYYYVKTLNAKTDTTHCCSRLKHFIRLFIDGKHKLFPERKDSRAIIFRGIIQCFKVHYTCIWKILSFSVMRVKDQLLISWRMF